MSIDRTQEVMERYWDRGDMTALAENVVFTDQATGERREGREAVVAMLRSVYREAFDVRSEDTRIIIGDGHAVREATLVGTHVGEYDGVPATGRSVRIPLCVTYVVEADQIVEGRVYFMRDAFRRQVGAGASTSRDT
jgi:steroid delta-isomerase-like uncharacterized protein